MTITNTAEPFDEDNPKHVEERNNRKLTADKIRQILINVRNNPDDSSRRWIWELIQNAKDVPNRFGKVSIDVTLNPDKLVFKHNGDTFSLSNLMSLVQQVSSKDSTNADEEVTGKFGTGFISTHLLSNVITVNGILKHREQLKEFELILDRKGESSEELLPKITAALNRLNDIDNATEFPVLEDTSIMNREEELSTSFSYEFDYEENKTAATNGLDDLVNTLPATLVNLEKVRKVTVYNTIEGEAIEYENVTNEERFYKTIVGLKKSTITINNAVNSEIPNGTPDQVFLSCQSGKDVFLTIPFDEKENALIPPAKGSPRLYRDFPLIGSHKFHFPFLINGTRFNPTERRDGIILHAKNDSSAVQNREILSRSFSEARTFIKKLVSLDVSNRYLLAFTRIPDSQWTDEFSKEWIADLQKELREFLIDQPLVETAAGECNTLKECYIPNYTEKTETRLSFYDLVTPFLGRNFVPEKDLLINWIDAVGPKDEIDSWPVVLYYDLELLVEQVEEFKNLSSLQEKLKTVNAILWLQEFYDFIYTQKESDYFLSNDILPDHYGEFKLLESGQLYKEDKNDPFDDHFLDLLKTVNDDDYREILIHRKVDASKISCETIALKEIFDEMNPAFRKKIEAIDGDEYPFLEREDCLSVLLNVLRVKQPSTQTDSLRFELLKHGKKLLNYDAELLTVGNIESINFEPAIRLFIRKINQEIEASESLTGLATELGCELEQTVEWLNTYLHLVYDSSTYEQEVRFGRVVPDHYGDFHCFEDLKDTGTEDIPIPDALIQALHELDERQDFKSRLISREVTIRKNEAFTFPELGTAIQNKVDEFQAEDVRTPGTLLEHKSAILDIIDWCEGNPGDASTYLKGFNQDQSSLFYKLVLGNADVKVRDIKLLADPANIEILHKINDSGIDPEKVNELLDSVDDASIDEVISHAKAVKEEAIHFQRMLKIGNDVEQEILTALRLYIPEATVSDPSGGKGSFDIRIENPISKKHYDLEIKSYTSGRGEHFLFSARQAKRALEMQSNYGVCLLRTLGKDQIITPEYVNENLRLCDKQTEAFQQGYSDYLSHDEITNRPGVSQLFLKVLGSPRVKVNGAHLISGSNNFTYLIQDIRSQIQ